MTVKTALLAALALASAGAARAQTPPPPSTQDFVTAAAHSDQYEMMAARDALAQSRDPRVRAFAEAMLRDHMTTSEGLRQAVLASRLTPPTPGLGDQAMLLSGLQGLTGPDFDKAYAKQQTLAHAQALTVQGLYASGGSDPNVRRAAQSALPIIQHHAEMARQLAAALGAQ